MDDGIAQPSGRDEPDGMGLGEDGDRAIHRLETAPQRIDVLPDLYHSGNAFFHHGLDRRQVGEQRSAISGA